MMPRKETKIWLSADQHFEHKNICRYCSRPFDSVGDMGRAFMAPYRENVHPFDTVYLLGDLVFNRKAIPQYVKPVGKTILIRGNHDKAVVEDYIRAGFAEVHDSLEIEYGGERILLVHNPMRVLLDEAKKRNMRGLNFDYPNILELAESLPYKVLCGHVHGLFRRLGQIVNVGVDVWGYRPITIEEALGAFDEPSSILGDVQHHRLE